MTLILVGFAALRVVTLADALATAKRQQPQLRHARAAVDVARAKADEARAPLLPQLTGTAGYQRATSNFAPRPQSGVPTTAVNNNFNSFNFFNFGITATQQIYDFGNTIGKYRAARAGLEAESASERDTWLNVELQVRTAFFNARAHKDLAEVARRTLANQERHLQQIDGFVTVGTRPEIDRLQAKTDRANARVQVITAENNYRTAKALLNQAIGTENPLDYDVSDEAAPELAGEESAIDRQVDEALGRRADLQAAEAKIRAQRLTVSAQKSVLYAPSLGISTSFTDAGIEIDQLAWNFNFSATLTWQLFTGLLHWSQLKEQRAALESLEADRDAVRLQVRLDVEQASLAVQAAKETLVAAKEATQNARERLRLAEGRYQIGVGNAIELGDSQLALTNAAAQEVGANYNLASARAQLARALGRP